MCSVHTSISSDQRRRAAGALTAICIEFCLHEASYCEVTDRKCSGFPVLISTWAWRWCAAPEVIEDQQKVRENFYLFIILFVSGCFCWHPACGSPSVYYDYVTIHTEQSENDSNVEDWRKLFSSRWSFVDSDRNWSGTLFNEQNNRFKSKAGKQNCGCDVRAWPYTGSHLDDVTDQLVMMYLNMFVICNSVNKDALDRF